MPRDSIVRRREPAGSPWRRHAVAASLGIALAALTAAVFPSSPSADVPLLDVGAVAPDNVISPFEFRVSKSSADLTRERDDVARSVAPVYRYTPAALDSARAQLTRFERSVLAAATVSGRTDRERADAVASAAAATGIRLTVEEAGYLASPARAEGVIVPIARLMDRWLPVGVATNADLEKVQGQVALVRDSAERLVDADDVPTFATLVARARGLSADIESPVGEQLALRVLGTFFRPTVVFDRTATELRRQERRRAVSTDRFAVRAGEKIVGGHEVVGRDEHDKLVALRLAMTDRRGDGDAFWRGTGSFAIDFLLLTAFGIALLLYRPALYRSTRALLFIALTFAIVIVSAAVMARTSAVQYPETIPVALAAILFSILFDPRISTVAAMLLAVLVGVQSPYAGGIAVFVGLIGGVAAAFSVRVVRRRNQALYSVTVIAVAYLLAAVAVGMLLGRPTGDVAQRAGWGAVNAMVSVALAMIVLPAAEELTGIDTYLRLLEWSDLNRPLMQQLSVEAPGTFAHTMLIANLTEAGCNAIGANGLLGRVGAYYHDIGKLKKSQYFVENQQRGRNPHDMLRPNVSASIIRDHVRLGLELADQHRLPRTVRAFISEHHGTVPIGFFLERAREQDPVPPNPDDYRYPGPIPQTVETAVCMLADGAEAASRALNEPTPDRIRERVDRIIRLRIEQGQLSDAPITLREIEAVKDEFVRVLGAMYHNRIDYPVSAGGMAQEAART